jgi:UDP-glucose 4-epimerase
MRSAGPLEAAAPGGAADGPHETLCRRASRGAHAHPDHRHGELGTCRNPLEADDSVEAISGVDVDPPRRRLHRADFHRIDPRNRERTAALVHEFRPTVIMHIGTYEPYARSSPKAAVERTATGTLAVMHAAVDVGTVERIIVRSGIEVFGRRRGASPRPHDDDTVDPTTPWGHSLRHAER